MTPSKLRRQGREAYFPGGDPNQECPYDDFNKFYHRMNRPHWIVGWREQALIEEEEDLEPEFCECCGRQFEEEE